LNTANEIPDELNPPPWDALYASCFHRLSEVEVRAWNYELREGPQRIRAINAVILANAIRRCAKRKDRDGKTIPAKLEDVRAAIFEILRENRRSDIDRIPDAVCADCEGTGFYLSVSVLRRNDTGAKVMPIVAACSIATGWCRTSKCKVAASNGTLQCNDLAVPCGCQAGQRIMQAAGTDRTKGGYDQAAVRRLQSMIRHERQERGLQVADVARWEELQEGMSF
jgi:hypothetical protein